MALDLRQPRARRARRSRRQRRFARRDSPSPAGNDDSLGAWRVRKSQRLAELFLRERPGAGDPAALEARLRRSSRRRPRPGPIWRSIRSASSFTWRTSIGDDVAQGLATCTSRTSRSVLACVDRRPGALDAGRTPLRRRRSTPRWRASIAARSCATRCARRCGSGCSSGRPGRRRASCRTRGGDRWRAGLRWRRSASRSICGGPRRARRAPIPSPISSCPATSTPRSTTCAIATRPSSRRRSATRWRRCPIAIGLLLRLTTVSGLSHEQIANIYKVNQSTVIALDRARRARRCSRRPSAASAASWAWQRDEFMSLAGLLVSRIDLSISRVLETSSPE